GTRWIPTVTKISAIEATLNGTERTSRSRPAAVPYPIRGEIHPPIEAIRTREQIKNGAAVKHHIPLKRPSLRKKKNGSAPMKIKFKMNKRNTAAFIMGPLIKG